MFIRIVYLIFFISPILGFAANVTYISTKHGWLIQNETQIRDFSNEESGLLKQISLTVVQKLIDKKIETVGDLSLKNLYQKLLTVNFKHVVQGYISPQGRMIGFKYEVAQTTVFITSEAIEKFFSQKMNLSQMILLHESLGALGYIDDNYQISALLIGLNNLSDSDLAVYKPQLAQLKIGFTQSSQNSINTEYLDSITDASTKAIMLAGGSTETGRGGDPLMLYVKAKLVELMMSSKESFEFVSDVLQSVNFERIIIGFDYTSRKLRPVTKYPLTYEEFLESSLIETKNAKYFVYLAFNQEALIFLKDIPRNLLKYLKENKAFVP